MLILGVGEKAAREKKSMVDSAKTKKGKKTRQSSKNV
jgi:hypothetical protein